MCDSAAIYQLRFATASERRFCLAVAHLLRVCHDIYDFSVKTKTSEQDFRLSFTMCNAIYQLRFATASERWFRLAVASSIRAHLLEPDVARCLLC